MRRRIVLMGFGASFLRDPDLFPARRAGELWGELRWTVDTLGGPYLFTGLDEPQAEALRLRFGGGPSGEPSGDIVPLGGPRGDNEDVEIRIFRASPDDYLPPDPDFFEYRPDVDYGASAVRLAGFDLMGLLELRHEPYAAALWTCRHEGEAFAEVAENFLRLLVAYRVAQRGGVLLHSAALARERRAILFPGCSGAGKTTLCRMAERRRWRVLSDELNVVSWREAGLTENSLVVEQVPFAGDFGRARPVDGAFRLQAVCRLEQAEREELAPLSPGGLLGLLLAASPFVNRDPFRGPDLEHRLAAMVEATLPAFTLSFALTSPLDVLDRLVEATVDAGT